MRGEGDAGFSMRRGAVRWSWAALPVAAVAAVLLVLQGQPGLHGIDLFGGHSVDPSMPAPMTGDGAALPNSVQGPWGGVGPGGTFLGRNMAKRRRIIQDQSDLWGRAEQGLGRLVAMSKGEWHPGPSEHGAKPEDGTGDRDRGESRADSYGAAQHHRRMDEVYADHASEHGRLDDDEHDGRSDDTRALRRLRRAEDERRGHTLDEAFIRAAGSESRHRGALSPGSDVQALRTAISRVKGTLGSTKAELEEALRRDERQESRAEEAEERLRRSKRRVLREDMWRRDSRDTRTLPRRLQLAAKSAAAGDGGSVKYDALGHKIEWPLLRKHAAPAPPSDKDEARKTLSDSLSGLENIVGAVEHRLDGYLRTRPARTRSARQTQESVAREFREKWAGVQAQEREKERQREFERRRAAARQSLQIKAAPKPSARVPAQDPSPNPCGSSACWGTLVPRRKVYEANPLSELVQRPHVDSGPVLKRLERQVTRIEGQISRLAARSQDAGASEDGSGAEGGTADLAEGGDAGMGGQGGLDRTGWGGVGTAEHSAEAGELGASEARRAFRRAQSALRGAGQRSAAEEDDAARGASLGIGGVPDGDPPEWALYAPQRQRAADDEIDSIDPHYDSDQSPRDAFRRQLAHIVGTTSDGDGLSLPTNIIDRLVHRRVTALALPGAGSSQLRGEARFQDLAQIPEAMLVPQADAAAPAQVSQENGAARAAAVNGDAAVEPGALSLGSSSGVVYVMGNRQAHALQDGDSVKVGGSKGHQVIILSDIAQHTCCVDTQCAIIFSCHL